MEVEAATQSSMAETSAVRTRARSKRDASDPTTTQKEPQQADPTPGSEENIAPEVQTSKRKHRSKNVDQQITGSQLQISNVSDSHSNNTPSKIEVADSAHSSPTLRKSTSGRAQHRPKTEIAAKMKLAAIVAHSMQGGDSANFLTQATAEDLEQFFPTIDHALNPGCRSTLGPEILDSLPSLSPSRPSPSSDETTNLPKKETFFAGAFIGSADIIDACLRNGADIRAKDNNGRNILHVLATMGHATLLRRVLRRLNKSFGSPAVVEGESSAPSDLSLVLNATDNQGWTPLLVGVGRGYELVVEALLAYPQVDRINTQIAHSCPPHRGPTSTKSSACHLAVISNSAPVLKRLLDSGSPLDLKDSMNRTVLHYIAAQASSQEAFDVVVKEDKFMPSMLIEDDERQRSPLFEAVANGNESILDLMLPLLFKQGSTDFSLASLLSRKDLYDLTCLQLTHLRGHTGMLFHLAKVWPTFKTEADPPSLREYLGELTPNASNPTVAIISSLEKIHFDRWLEIDLSTLERSTVAAVKHVLGPQGITCDLQLKRAIHRFGAELCLRCCVETGEVENSGGITLRDGISRRTPESVFYHLLKLRSREILSPQKASDDWRFVLEGRPMYNRLASGTSAHSDGAASSIILTRPLESSPPPNRNVAPNPPCARKAAPVSGGGGGGNARAASLASMPRSFAGPRRQLMSKQSVSEVNPTINSPRREGGGSPLQEKKSPTGFSRGASSSIGPKRAVCREPPQPGGPSFAAPTKSAIAAGRHNRAAPVPSRSNGSPPVAKSRGPGARLSPAQGRPESRHQGGDKPAVAPMVEGLESSDSNSAAMLPGTYRTGEGAAKMNASEIKC